MFATLPLVGSSKPEFSLMRLVSWQLHVQPSRQSMVMTAAPPPSLHHAQVGGGLLALLNWFMKPIIIIISIPWSHSHASSCL
jgi:hypothetical protein